MKTPRPKVVRMFLDDHEIDLENLTTEETNPMATDPSIVITRLRIRNFRGLENLDVPVGPSGCVFLGTNGEGKTTAIEAINAAAEGLGIGPGHDQTFP
jgi:ABC-type multidrug transport system ATPase subunit